MDLFDLYYECFKELCVFVDKCILDIKSEIDVDIPEELLIDELY